MYKIGHKKFFLNFVFITLQGYKNNFRITFEYQKYSRKNHDDHRCKVKNDSDNNCLYQYIFETRTQQITALAASYVGVLFFHLCPLNAVKM